MTNQFQPYRQTKFLPFLFLFIVATPELNAQADWNNTSFVHRNNQQILDGQNNAIKLNGVNLGGWLMWEGWIWGGGFTAEKDINNNMQSIIGSAATTAFKDSVYKKFITREDIHKIAQECFNVVRIPINHTLLEDDFTPYVYKPAGWTVLDSVLKWCEDYNVYALLDLHSAPGGQSTSFTADPDFLINLWNGSINQERTKRLWKAIADRYKNRGIIAGYDLLNEPNVSNNADLLALYDAVIDSVRSVDNNHMLHIEGNNYAQDFSMFSSLPDPNMCFHFHFYTWFFSSTKPANLYVFTQLSDSLNVPIWCGEWGENDLAQLDTTLTLLNDPYYKVNGNAFWTWKKVKQAVQYPYYNGIDTTYEWNKSITWMGNTGSPMPTVSEMQTGINYFLNNSNIQNCTFDNTMSNLLRVCSSVGIESISANNETIVYPNPFTTKINADNFEQHKFFELINSSGQTVWSGQQTNGNDFSTLPNGLYFLKIKTQHLTQTMKLIKQ